MTDDPPDLVTGYRLLHGDSDRLAVEALNDALGTRYTRQRGGHWRVGQRAVPQPVQDVMRRAVLAGAIEAEGGVPPADDAALDRLAARLCPPARP